MIIFAVAEAYENIKNLPWLSASNTLANAASFSTNSEAIAALSTNRRWSPDFAHFAIDCEHAVRDALSGRPDRDALERAWDDLLESGDLDPSPLGFTLVQALAPVFVERKLHPATYFRKTYPTGPTKVKL